LPIYFGKLSAIFLREQMRAIQRELGESDPNAVKSECSAKRSSRRRREAKQVATRIDRL
jgi:ATP-dependent Lon protease